MYTALDFIVLCDKTYWAWKSELIFSIQILKKQSLDLGQFQQFEKKFLSFFFKYNLPNLGNC